MKKPWWAMIDEDDYDLYTAKNWPLIFRNAQLWWNNGFDWYYYVEREFEDHRDKYGNFAACLETYGLTRKQFLAIKKRKPYLFYKDEEDE